MNTTSDLAKQLMLAVQNIPITGFERSFKMAPGFLRSTRFIFGINPKDLPFAHLSEIAASLSAPDRFFNAMAADYTRANQIGFGFEGDGNNSTYRIYFEFWDTIHQEVSADNRPRLLHSGYKWKPSHSSANYIGQYFCYPFILKDAAACRMKQILFNSEPTINNQDSIFQFAQFALEKTPSRSVIYSEITEEKSTRASFDLNVYESQLDIGTCTNILQDIGRIFHIPAVNVSNLLRPIENARLGHISAGRDKHSRSFISVYYNDYFPIAHATRHPEA